MAATSILSDLVEAVSALYRACPNIPFKTGKEMDDALRAADKGQLYLDGDFEALWIMEHEDKERMRVTIQTATQAMNAAMTAPLHSVEVHDTSPGDRHIPMTTSTALAPLSPNPGDSIYEAGGFRPSSLSPILQPMSNRLLTTTPNMGPLLPSPIGTARSDMFSLDF
jgi:hypothetical protein